MLLSDIVLVLALPVLLILAISADPDPNPDPNPGPKHRLRLLRKLGKLTRHKARKNIKFKLFKGVLLANSLSQQQLQQQLQQGPTTTNKPNRYRGHRFRDPYDFNSFEDEGMWDGFDPWY